MIKNRKRVAAAGVAVAAVLGGATAGVVFGPIAAGADSSSDSTTSSTTAATTAPAQTPAAGQPDQQSPPPRAVMRVDRLSVAAGALGVSESDLRTALQGGKSITQVASDKGVDLQKVTDALVAADTKAIDQAVTDGKVTQAQADQMKSNTAAHVQDEVNRTGLPAGRGGPGHGGGPADGVNRPNDVAVAAGVLNMSESDLRTALQGGKSISQVASDKGVDVQKVIDALVAADTKAIDQAVTDGKLTQAQADQLKSNLATHVQDEVNRTGFGGGPGGPGDHGRGDGVARPNDVAVAAGALGISESDLQTALQGGKSISQVASDKGVDAQKVIDALVAADTKAIDQAVTDGKLTQAQADQMKSNLKAHVQDEIDRTGFGGHGPHDGGAPPAAPTATA